MKTVLNEYFEELMIVNSIIYKSYTILDTYIDNKDDKLSVKLDFVSEEDCSYMYQLVKNVNIIRYNNTFNIVGFMMSPTSIMIAIHKI
jgi:hypothetical protein